MSFYKYTTISTAALVLKNKSLRWSSPVVFNDLEECQFTPFTNEQYIKAYNTYIDILTEYAKGNQLGYDVERFSDVNMMIISLMQISLQEGSFTTEGFAEQMLRFAQNSEGDFRDYINKALINTFRILCVTEDADNNLMWAHYGDQHKGCVIELESVYSKRPRALREGKVRYHENLEPQTNPIDVLLYGETPEIRDIMIQDVIFSKRTNWNYEKEYRLMFAESFGEIRTQIEVQTMKKEITVNQSDKLFTDVAIEKEAVKSIVFGARTSVQDIKDILAILEESKYDCKTYQMTMKDGKMVKEELDLSLIV
ncbi:DUF2971 domain-containing protein [Chryseobacterium culicis]|uniref:DUF2971 domain-containing protein n=1 Tax=Chryseobacterium culicis TaxID=680127 RepID=UPI00289A8496|nr:DUF2971 domain-containing protein [Chryseobacterium culicis]